MDLDQVPGAALGLGVVLWSWAVYWATDVSFRWERRRLQEERRRLHDERDRLLRDYWKVWGTLEQVCWALHRDDDAEISKARVTALIDGLLKEVQA